MANNLNQYTSITTPGDFSVLAEVPASVATSAVSLAGSLGNRTENIIAWYRNVTNGTTGVLASNSVVMNTTPQQTITGSTYVPKNLVNPQYDFDGNLTDDGLWTYTWDAENRLTSMAMKPSVGYSTRIKMDFIYDSENRRVSKAVSTTTASTWTLQSTTRFLYDGWNMIAQYGFSGSTFTPAQAEYVWGLDLTGDMQGAGGVGGLLHARLIDTGNALCLPCYDGNGNIAAWFDAGTSTLIDRREYDSFGGMVSLYKLTANATLHSKLHFGFSTKFTDSESGFLYYGHRYYNPVTQRWLNRDPIEEEGGVNLYGFVGNDGVNSVDQLGLEVVVLRVQSATELVKGSPENILFAAQSKLYENTLKGYVEDVSAFSKEVESIIDWTKTNWGWEFTSGKISASGKLQEDILEYAKIEMKSRVEVINAGGKKEIIAKVKEVAHSSSEYVRIVVMMHSDGTCRFPNGTSMGTADFNAEIRAAAMGKDVILVACGQRLTGKSVKIGKSGLKQNLTYYETVAFKPDNNFGKIVKSGCKAKLDGIYPVKGYSEEYNGAVSFWEDPDGNKLK